MRLEPYEEAVGETGRYRWQLPLDAAGEASASARRLRSVWYIGLPLTSAHRGSHSGGGALVPRLGGQERYLNEGTVYPHASLVEMITYHLLCFPLVDWRYLDLSHHNWADISEEIAESPPDVAAFSVYTATAPWAYIVAAAIKRANPAAIVVFGNDHAGVLHEEVLTGKYGSRLVDFVSIGNNGPYTMMGLLYFLQERLDLAAVPSVAYRGADGKVVRQSAATYPLNRRLLPDYSLIEKTLERDYDPAFALWYQRHYGLPRMITLPLDGGCHWGSRPSRRCKHCSIQGLTPKVADVERVVPALEAAVGRLGANVYAAGDSTLGFSREQWRGEFSFLDDLAEACDRSPVLRGHRFMLAYGLVREFLSSAPLCQGFVRTWNVGIEAFNPKLLKADSKGINGGHQQTMEAFDLARRLDYRLYISGILGLPGTTMELLDAEVKNWVELTHMYQEIITTVSVAAPAIIPGSRMYWELFNADPAVRDWHGELLPNRLLTERYIARNTDVTLADVEAALADLAGAVVSTEQSRHPVKFGGYMFGGVDATETHERRLLDELLRGHA
jgi:radical SAM superfamily enzyme YgiQ (UPF0313 family)